ncbi:MAG: glycosyltransferase family 4 protein [Desulfobacterales bacterium]|nr:glycosyltransferase family 4 protein [Desulfobacterales bacterium]
MNIAAFSHSYLEPENRKNILALTAYASVRVILPSRGPVLIFRNYEFERSHFGRKFFMPFRPLYLFNGQYLLWTSTMGLRRFQPDVINVEYNPWSAMFFQVILYRALFCRRAKLICTVKKNTYRRYPSWRGWLKKWLSRFSFKRIDHIIAASAMAARLYEHKFSVPEHRITKLHHLGVDTSLFVPKPVRQDEATRPITIGYCGRFDVDKGITDLITAVYRVQSRVTRSLVLRLLGDGSLTLELKQQAANTDWLEILPPVANAEVAGFLQDLDIFVLPSRILEDHQEHDAHALLEALAVGVPTIGTRSGIISEILGDGTGLLVRPKEPDELAAAIEELMNDHRARKMLGMRGRKKAENEFALDVIAQQKIKTFQRVLDE